MGILGNIMSAIFGGSASAAPAPGSTAPGPAAAPAPGSAAPGPAAAPAAAPSGTSASTAQAAPAAAPSGTSASTAQAAPARTPISAVDVAAVMDGLAAKSKQKLDWRKSIVDLMKLLDMDSSLAARKELAKELHYTGDTGDSAKMNVWLHKQVMNKLAENGGKVPEDLKH
jgi:Domain of unknown function (DUF3597)